MHNSVPAHVISLQERKRLNIIRAAVIFLRNCDVKVSVRTVDKVIRDTRGSSFRWSDISTVLRENEHFTPATSRPQAGNSSTRTGQHAGNTREKPSFNRTKECLKEYSSVPISTDDDGGPVTKSMATTGPEHREPEDANDQHSRKPPPKPSRNKELISAIETFCLREKIFGLMVPKTFAYSWSNLFDVCDTNQWDIHDVLRAARDNESAVTKKFAKNFTVDAIRFWAQDHYKPGREDVPVYHL